MTEGREPPRGLAWREAWKGAVFEARTPCRRLWGLALSMFGLAVLVPYAAFVPEEVYPVTAPFVLVAVWLVYNGLAYLLGRARIRLGRGRLEIAWRPLPTFGGKRMPMQVVVGFEARARSENTQHTWVAARVTGAPVPRFLLQMYDEEHAAFVVARLNAAYKELTRSGG
jgi:hypothetical protein